MTTNARTIARIMDSARKLGTSPAERLRARRITEDLECVAPSDVELAGDFDATELGYHD